MKKIQKVFTTLRRYPPTVLARETLWRAWRPYHAARLHAAILRNDHRAQFRSIPYYRPNLTVAAEAQGAIVAYADEVCSGKFPFLGYESADLGLSPRWNVDFVSGYEWSPKPVSQMCPVVRGNGSDVKVPWELSRLQFLPVLVKAHLLTGSPKYREAAKALFSDWDQKNPVGVGVNWTLAMESALRGMSLCFMLSLLQPLRPDEREWGAQVVRSILQHLFFTEAEIEFSHLVSSNHYLSNVVALHCMATFLAAPGMERRRVRYRRLVQREMLRQVYQDGGDYEASFGYHLLVLQMFTNAFLLMHADNYSPLPQFGNRLRAMYRYLAEIANEDGRVPQVGDSDDGRVELMASDLHQMTSLPTEKRDSLFVPGAIGLGDALFNLGCGGDPADAAWFGLNSQARRTSRVRKTVFVESGVAVARVDDAEIVFCAIPNGIHGAGSHTHNDKLSIVARVNGVELLCDSGTGYYTRDSELRNKLRSTKAHNTVVIDGLEQNVIEPGALFQIGRQAAVSPIEVNDLSKEIRLAASHSGYDRISVGHRRVVRLRSSQLSIEDILSGPDEHAFEVFWHLPESWCVDKVVANSGFELRGPVHVSVKVESTLSLTCSHNIVPISRSYGGALNKGVGLGIAGFGRFPCSVTTTFSF
jgi:hypothetical protein